MVIKREYKRCKTECSSPPIYILTGNHFRAKRENAEFPISNFSRFATRIEDPRFRKAESGQFSNVIRYPMKYQAESKNVSETSVSRRALFSHFGHFVS